MISAKTFSPKVKSMNSSFIKNVYIFDIFYQFPQFEQSKSEVWKGKNLCARGVKKNNHLFWNNYNENPLSEVSSIWDIIFDMD